MKKLFEEFPAISKAEWLAKIAKDLKGKAPADFNWRLAPGVEVSAFPHADDRAGLLPHPIAEGENRWQICEGFQVENEGKTNRMALNALAGGAEALRFVCSKTPDFAALLEGIDLGIISIHFKAKKMEAPLDLLRNFADYADANTHNLQGSFCWQATKSSPAELLNFTQENLSKFKVLPVHGSAFFDGDENTAIELSKIAQAANDWFAKLTENGINAETIAQQVFFTIFIGKNYFLQIAKLRALRKFWLELQRKWGVEIPQPAFVFAQFPLSEQSPDANTNLIQATTQAMSAVIGGVDVLTVLPSDKTNEETQPTDFSRRMARNVQHILKMESHFDWVADPAAGSYFIESLTEKLLKGMEV